MHSINLRSVTLALLALGLAVPALAGSAAASTSDPCALVTQSEASAAMHVASLPPKRHSGRSGTSCRYYSPDHKMNVYVQMVGADDMMGAQQLGGKTLPGIGDKAVWAAGSIFVQKGGKVAQVGLYLSAASLEKMDPAAVTLAKTAAGRM